MGMNGIVVKTSAWVLAAGLITLSFTGCSRNETENKEENEKNGSKSGQSEEQPPETLTDMEKGLESLIMSLNGPAAMKDEMQQGSGQEGDSGSTGGQQEPQGQQANRDASAAGTGSSGSSGSSGGTGAGSEGGGSTGVKAEPVTITNANGIFKVKMTDSGWQGLVSLVNGLHYQWNSFEPEAAQKGAQRNLLEEYGNALNKLTDSALGRQVDNCVFLANLAYSFIPDFYRLYKNDCSPELKRIRYYVRNCILSSLAGNWEQAANDLQNLKSLWSAKRMIISKDFPEASGILEYSTMELEKVVAQKNQPLSDIKGRIALSNIVTIEKLMEKQPQGGDDSTGRGQEGGNR